MTLSDLAPILAAVIGPMLVMVLALMRYQHVDSTKTRTLMYELIGKSSKENRELIEKSSKENRELIEKSSKENRELIEKYHSELKGELSELKGELKGIVGEIGEIKERLSYIEGYLRLPSPPVSDGDADEAQAA